MAQNAEFEAADRVKVRDGDFSLTWITSGSPNNWTELD